jgi:LemA protein
MSNAQLAVLVAAALFVFWMLGAYNRLVALRNAIGDAWQMVDEVLKKRGDAIGAIAAALREPLAGEQGALDALLAADAQVRAAASALGARPVMAPLAAELQAAEAQMSSAASRVLALLAQHAELNASEAVSPHAQALVECAQRLGFARQMFNDAAQVYNAAARQFPTRLLTRLYGFGTAGRL